MDMLTPPGPSRRKTRPNEMTPSPGPPSPAATVHAVATEANAANPAWVFVAEDPGALPVRYDTDEKIVAALQPMTTDKLSSLVSQLTRKDSRRVRPVDLLVEISCGDSIRL